MGRPYGKLCSVNACLYDRLGGAAAVAAVVDDAIDRHAANPALAPLFCGKDLPQLKAFGVSVFSARVGGPCSNEAADPTRPDAGMRFSPVELQAVVGDMTEALHEHGVGMVEVAEVVNLLYTAREAVPREPPFSRERFKNAGRIACNPAGPRVDLPNPRRVDMNQVTTTLYERLGRREGITRITADLMKNHLANPLVNARYLNSEDLARVERRAVEFFCAGTGGPEEYTGKDMVATHKGMNINEQEFMAVIDDAMDALQKNGIDEATRNEVLAILWSMRREVLRV